MRNQGPFVSSEVETLRAASRLPTDGRKFSLSLPKGSMRTEGGLLWG